MDVQREKRLYKNKENSRTWRSTLSSEELRIHIDASKTHPWGIMIQNVKPMDFYLHKLTTT